MSYNKTRTCHHVGGAAYHNAGTGATANPYPNIRQAAVHGLFDIADPADAPLLRPRRLDRTLHCVRQPPDNLQWFRRQTLRP